MILTESIDPKGHLTIQIRDAQGNLVDSVSANNSIVTSGRDLVARLFVSDAPAHPSHVAIGTGTTTTLPSMTALAGEFFRKPINAINEVQDIVQTIDNKIKVTISCELDANEGNGAITEAGIFNAGAGGAMYNRVVFPPVNKTSDFQLTLIWEITF